jgi:hypothetical protein
MSRNDDPADRTGSPEAGGNSQRVIPVPPPHRTPRAWLLIALAVTFAVGVVLGLGLGSGQPGGEPTSSTATRASAIQPAPAPSTVVVTRPTASSACLETARRADKVINLLITNRRNDAAKQLVAYSVASRQCRRDASP